MRAPLLLLAGLTLAAGCDLGEVDDAEVLAAGGYPTCSAAATDPDGDGWGWEPARSCVMAGSGIDAPAYPGCSRSATDPDGDGWGWDPAQSCRVAQGGGGGVAGGCTYVDGFCAPGSSGCAVYTDDGTRAGVKQEIWQTMYALNTQGVDGLPAAQAAQRRAEAQCRADLAVAMAMQETHTFAVDGAGNLPYDASKDGNTDGSQNVCVFNLNIDFIRRSCKTDCGRFQSFATTAEKRYLNQRGSLRECVRRLSEGFDRFGIDGSLHFHRGGSSGWARPGADERGFATAQKIAADHLRDAPGARADGTRVASSIPHR